MAYKSKIEWCDATWNPIVGCSRVSAGCENCYAEKVAYRFKHITKFENVVCEDKPKWNNSVFFDDKALEMPLRWKKPRRIFVCSMGDLFHKNVPDIWIDKVFAIMALCPQHTFMVLTKRPERMREYINSNDHNGCGLDYQLGTELRPLMEIAIKKGVRFPPFALPLPNLWLGVSVENQETANERIPILLDTPAAVRFISAEPLLGPIDLKRISQDFDDGTGFFVDNCLNGKRFNQEYGDYDNEASKLDWVIVGGESGKNARAMLPDWVRKLRDDCEIADVPFFFKQWGEFLPFTNPTGVARVGKKTAGNHLDGKQHLEFPKIGGA